MSMQRGSQGGGVFEHLLREVFTRLNTSPAVVFTRVFEHLLNVNPKPLKMWSEAQMVAPIVDMQQELHCITQNTQCESI